MMMPLIAAIRMFFRLNPSAEVRSPTHSHTHKRTSKASPAILVGFISNAKLTIFFYIIPIFLVIFSNFAFLYRRNVNIPEKHSQNTKFSIAFQ